MLGREKRLFYQHSTGTTGWLGVSWTIYVNVDSPNLGFPYFNFLGGIRTAGEVRYRVVRFLTLCDVVSWGTWLGKEHLSVLIIRARSNMSGPIDTTSPPLFMQSPFPLCFALSCSGSLFVVENWLCFNAFCAAPNFGFKLKSWAGTGCCLSVALFSHCLVTGLHNPFFSPHYMFHLPTYLLISKQVLHSAELYL